MESDLANNGQQRWRRQRTNAGGEMKEGWNWVCTEVPIESRKQLRGNYLLARQIFTITMFMSTNMNLLDFNYRLETDMKIAE